ncbi:MAG: TonB-dependent receptor [Gammaproteobacteria bacterium]|nr:TonB-dependent receptor [Gammaproteobacteria bacterium]
MKFTHIFPAAAGLFLVLIVAAEVGHAELEEVIVTTQKVRESVLEVPHTVAVIDAQTIENLSIDSIESFYHFIPSLNYAPIAGDRTGVRLFIRGIGSTDSLIGQDSSVSVYRDGIYQSRGQGLNLKYSDIERIEVLKGPNGTLYGRNTVGGSVNIISRRASTDEVYGRVSVATGSYALRTADGTINVPMSDTVAVKFSVFSDSQDGWISNASADPDYSGHDHRGFRFDASFDNDLVRLDYSIDRSSAQDSGFYYQPTPSDFSTGLNPILVSEGVYDDFSGNRLNQVNGSNRDNAADSTIHAMQLVWDFSDNHSFKFLTGLSSSSSRSFTNFDNAYNNTALSNTLTGLTAKSTLSEAQLIAKYSTSSDPNEPASTSNANINDAVNGYNLLLDNYHKLVSGSAGVNAQLSALGAPMLNTYRNIKQIESYDESVHGQAVYGRSPAAGRPFANDSFSAEFQFSGSSDDDQVRYISGLYYFSEENDYAQYVGQNDVLEWLSGYDLAWTERTDDIPREEVTSMFGSAGSLIRNGKFIEAAAVLREVSDIIQPLAQADGNLLLEGGSLNAEYASQASSVAGFANVSYLPSEKWDFTLGLRLSLDTRSINTVRYDPLPATGELTRRDDFSHSLNKSFEHANYLLVARYRPAQNSNLYISVTSSYRAGGFNESFTSRDGADLAFDKEEIRSYEMGYKAAFGSSVRLLTSVFFYQLPGLQYAVFNPFNPTQRSTVNTEGTVQGLDIEFIVELFSDWHLALAYASLERDTDPYINPFDSEIGYPAAIQSPHNSVNVVISGTVVFADLYEMNVRLGVDYNSKTNILEGISQIGYALARLDINFILDAVTLSLWSKNLTDTSYVIDGLPFASATGTGPDLLIFGQPRTLGFSAAYTF